MRIAPYLMLSTVLIIASPAYAEGGGGSVAPAVTPVVHMVPGSAQKSPMATPAAAAGSPAPASSSSAPASSAAVLTDAQKAAVEDIIKEYLTQKNPEVLMEAMQELQKRQTADSTAKSKAALSGSHDKLYADANSPVGGNPKGDVTIVEFFDYQCGYCKMSEPTVNKLLKDDKNVKFIYKDFPILGPSSTFAAKAALASIKQGKYQQFHDALVAAKFTHGANQAADEETVMKAAKDVGLDVDKLKKDMDDPATTKIVEDNVSLGTEIGARGTPTFIIGEQVFPGALEYPQLKKAVDDARAKPATAPAGNTGTTPAKKP